MTVVNIPNSFFQHDAQSKFDPDVHIDPGFDINKYIVKEGSNVLIEGIRGTGKTHILKMISTRLLENFKELRILPVYISMAEVSEFVSKDEDLFRMHVYSKLILETISTIKRNKYIIENTSISFFDKLINLFRLKEQTDINKLIDEIEQYANELHDNVLNNKSKLTENITKTAGVNGQLKTPVANLGSNLTEATATNVEYLTVQLSHMNASQFITNFYNHLYELFSLEHTVLLIDECSDLPKEAQKEIFKFFKLLRGGTRVDNSRNSVYFIGAVYPPQATEYPSKVNGDSFDFEPGDDCSIEYLELDIQSTVYEDFFKRLFIKKMDKINVSSNTQILDYFEDDKALLLATYAAHGLPRRFFEILHQSYENLKEFAASQPETQSKVYKIRFSDISSAIDRIVTGSLLTKSKLSEDNFDTLEKIVAALKKRNKKVETESSTKEKYVPINFYFVCPRKQESLLGNLIAKGVIHNQARTRSLKSISSDGPNKGLVMMIDLAVAFTEGAIPTKTKSIDYFQKDIKIAARRGYEFCQQINFQ
ncbi:hypothetical protein QI30_18380 [Kurthia sp. 3B1D]|uniref:Uncharacterized protein n=1 Tax=Candidatus Kurthia intestinigallinarum TaxID=1562256 RepID=A0A433RQ15_9BACL|nr:hypothetical protein [Kurthia sp. 3B1D]RUS51961.1 hypothetical protein QI30_18380 [Kurthia sp. 3B1D]